MGSEGKQTRDGKGEKKKEESVGMEIVEANVAGIDSTDVGLIENYQVTIKLFDSLPSENAYFNPFILNKISKNPFTLSERTYPVDFGNLSEESYELDIALPTVYDLVSKPADVNIVLAERGGQFFNRIKLENNRLRCEQVLRFNKMIFAPDEYLSLKEFFSRIIQLEKTDIVLKKRI